MFVFFDRHIDKQKYSNNYLSITALLAFEKAKKRFSVFCTDPKRWSLPNSWREAGLQRCQDDKCKLIFFYSKKLSDTDIRYCAFEKELFAIYAAVRQFCHLLEEAFFYDLTDHKPLISAMTAKSDKYTP